METQKFHFKTIGENIKKARKSKGIKQEWLALKVHVDKSEISRIESGKRIPSLTALIEIAKVLETEPGLLFL